MRNLIFALMIAFGIAGCETTDVAPIAAGERPEDKTTDEAGLWKVMDDAEDDLKTAAVVVDTEDLNAYVKDVTCRVTGPDYCDDLRIYIVDAPYFNATMAPNGMMQVWTGFLLRAENEAQMAFVLGHEFIHYQERHSVQQFRSYKNAANASLLFGVAAAASGVPDAAYLGSSLIAARLYGFGRDHERAADRGGFRVAVEAGYDPSQGAKLWEGLIAEVGASSSKRKQRRAARASIYSTHPVSTERVDNLRALAKDLPAGELGAERYREAIAPHLDDWLDRDITRRDFGEHFFLIERLMAAGHDPGVLNYRLGEAYRVRREEGDLPKAQEAYALATEHATAPIATWRELGNVRRRLGDSAGALDAFTTYLSKAPDADDRALVEQIIGSLEPQG